MELHSFLYQYPKFHIDDAMGFNTIEKLKYYCYLLVNQYSKTDAAINFLNILDILIVK